MLENLLREGMLRQEEEKEIHEPFLQLLNDSNTVVFEIQQRSDPPTYDSMT